MKDYELEYSRLLAEVRAIRDKVGDQPMRTAGAVAVDLLNKTLERHKV